MLGETFESTVIEIGTFYVNQFAVLPLTLFVQLNVVITIESRQAITGREAASEWVNLYI